MRGTGDVRFDPNGFLHRERRGDPRSAAARPAGAIVHIHFQAEAPGFGDRMMEHVAPLGCAEADGAGWDFLSDIHQEDTADADALHCFEVGSDALAGDITVEPEPIDPRAGGGRRVEESGFEIVPEGFWCCGEEKENPKDE